MIILVGGSGSSAGKTTFIRIILKIFPGQFSVVKVTPSAEMPDKIEKKIDILSKEGKDTSYFISEGAKKVIWVHGKREKLGFLLKKTLSDLNGHIIIEGNSPILHVDFDIAVFVEKDLDIIEKGSAILFKNKANYIVVNKPESIIAYVLHNIIYANLKAELDSLSENFKEILLGILRIT